MVAAVISQEEKILICQRKPDGAHPLKWEFPGGKVEQAEEPRDALQRELWEELRIHAVIGPQVCRYTYAYPGKNPILLIFYRVAQFTGVPENCVFQQIRWSQRSALQEFDFLEGDRDFVEKLILSSDCSASS